MGAAHPDWEAFTVILIAFGREKKKGEGKKKNKKQEIKRKLKKERKKGRKIWYCPELERTDFTLTLRANNSLSVKFILSLRITNYFPNLGCLRCPVVPVAGRWRDHPAQPVEDPRDWQGSMARVWGEQSGRALGVCTRLTQLDPETAEAGAALGHS